MAFLSNRSGLYQIWLYELASGTYRQLTGVEGSYIEATWGKLEWLDGNTVMFVAYPDGNTDSNVLNAVYKIDL